LSPFDSLETDHILSNTEKEKQEEEKLTAFSQRKGN
jgi:hypothetical protein